MALKVGELFASFNLDTSGIGSALNGAEKSLSSAGKSLAVGGAAVTAAVTAPLIAAGKDIAKKGSEFDAQMSKVFAIAGDEVTGSAEAMEKLRAKALEMGSTTQFTASEAGEAFEYMAMAGWKTESMLSAIEPLMNLAAAAGADLGTTSDIVTDAMTAFGLKATDMMTVVKDGVQMSVPAVEYFADILAATSTNSNTNVTMLGESFKYVAPLAGSFGYSLNDVSLALGLMANNGIKSTMAGTSLSRVIQNMTKPSKETKEAMSALGLSLYDAKGQMKPLREVMNDFRSVAKKNGLDVSKLSEDVAKLSDKLEKGEITEEQYEKELAKLTDGSGDFMKYVTQIAGARGLPGLLAIMNSSQEDFDSLAKSIDNATGSSKKMKDVMLDNMKGDLTIFKSAVEGLEITLWDLVKEPMRGLVQRGTQIVDTFRNMDKSTQKGALRMAAFAAAIGPAMTAAGGLLTVLPKIRKVLLGLASPVGLVSIGLLALGAAAMDADNLMGQNLEKMANTAKTKLQDLQKNLLGKHLKLSGRANRFLGSVQRAITTAVPGIVDAVSGLLQTGLAALTDVLPEAAKTATTMVSTLASGIARNAPQLTKTLAGTLTSLVTSVISAVPDMLDAGITLFTALIDSLGKVNWTEIGTKINTAVTGALSEIKTNLFTLVFGEEPKEGDLGDWGKFGSKVVEKIKEGIKTASQNGKNLLGGLVLGDDYNPDDSWGTVAGKIWNKITEAMEAFLSGAGDLIKGLALGENYTADASWGDVATAIWNKIKAAFTALKANAKDLLGTIALGEGYTADTTWETVGQAIWDKIKAKFTTLSASAKDIVGKLVLGEGYTADVSWGDIGQAIWDKAKEKFSTLAKSAKDLIGTLALGDGYTADESWANIGQALWDKIKEKLTALSANAKDLIGNLVYSGGEEGYSADKSWADIGSALWEKVQSGITAGKDMAAAILEKIGSVEIDVEGVMTTVKNAGTFVSNLVGNMLNGKITWGTKITDLAQKIGNKLAAYGWDNIGTTLGQVANNLITAITDAIPNAVDAAGNAIDVGLTLASGIMNSIVTAIGDSSLASGFSNLVQGLVTGIVTAVERLPEMLGNVLSVGAQIANAIMGSITSALTDMEASGIAASLGQAAVDLVKGLLSSVGDLSKNTDVQSFMQNLGEGLRSALGMLGDICGEIIGWIFSTEGLKSIYNAGVTVANLLKQGLDAGLGATLNFFEHMFEGALVNLGLVNADDLEAAKESGKLLADTITESARSELADTTQGKTFIDLMNWGVMNGSENKGFVDTSAVQFALKKAYDSSEGDVEKFRDQFFNRFLESMSNDREFMKAVTGHDILSEWIGDVLEATGDEDADFTNWFDYLKYLVRKGELNASDFVPEDMDFWQAFYDAYANNDTTAMMNLLASKGKEMFSGAAEAAEEATQGTAKGAAQEAAEAAREALTGSYEQAAADAEETITSTMNQAGVNGVRGFTTGTKETAGEAEGAALQVSDDVVKTFLLTMSEENGYLIGENFVLALGFGMGGQTDTLKQTAVSIARSGYTSMSQTANYDMGYSIGSNFGRGFVNGIRAMIDEAAQAAAELGAAGTNGLSNSIAEGSPSKITAMSGTNFGLGFVNSILLMADQAADAAREMGAEALSALDYTARDMGRTAIDQTDMKQRSAYTRTAEAAREARGGSADMQELTDRIVTALEKVGVYIDGEEAGHLLTRYISEEIAEGASARR